MTTASPITASLATACAAHDRHRLDVLDALLDEAAPSAVRELLGAALDLCATLHARRDEMTAQLGEARATADELNAKITDIARVVFAEGPEPIIAVADVIDQIQEDQARLASERAHLAACQTRIAGLEQAANERSAEVARLTADYMTVVDAIMPSSDGPGHAAATARSHRRHIAELEAEVARLTARVAELEARPVLTAQWIAAKLNHLGYSLTHAEADAAAIMSAFPGPVTLPPAQDRATAERLLVAMGEFPTRVNAATWQAMIDKTSAALASLGATPTSRDTVRDAMERAAARFGGSDGVFNAAGFSTALMHAAGLSGAVDGRLVRAILAGRCDVQDRGDGHYQITPPPTSQLAARPVFAGVSVEELAAAAHNAECDHMSEDRPGDVWPFIVRAVLARLEVSLVAPVDPEAVARDYANNAATGYAPGIDHPPYWFEYTDEQRTKRTAAMRATLIARGIPVTPEVDK